MSFVLYLFGSGGAFFGGAAMVLAGFFGRIHAKRNWIDRVSVFSTEIGLVFVVLSAVPIPYAAYAVAIGLTLLWLATEKSERKLWMARRAWIRGGVVGAWVFAIAIELPYQFPPSVLSKGGESIHIIGDSVTAGLGDEVKTWPKILREQSRFDIHDYSQPAATTARAMSQAAKLPEKADLVIVEIGGNDLLGTTTSAQFEQDLNALLSRVRERSDTVLMFELPLPPLCNEYGRIQRRLAAKHQVHLIPKRLFIYVLASSEATSDSIHLTQDGHTRMASIVASLIHLK